MAKKNVLILGSGGREHALLTKLAESTQAGKLYAAPGNGGMAELAELVDININDPLAVSSFAKDKKIDLVVLGPEAPLVAGVADACRAAGIACFGPNAEGAKMEGSKKFAKQLMGRAAVPTAPWRSFSSEEECAAYVGRYDGPCVIKADGLAAGKGVVVAKNRDEALAGVKSCFNDFGDAGKTVLVEETLEGPECSMLVLTDGKLVLPLALSQDHKRAYDGDQGPNTGGMGVYSPVPSVSDEDYREMLNIMKRVVEQLAKDKIAYSGCLYGGFMLTAEGPKVLEFNARMGDPETQVILPRMQADLIELFLACDAGTLDESMLSWKDEKTISVVLASAGYPGSYEVEKTIEGIEDAEKLEGVYVYHAGTKREGKKLLTAGGRVLNVCASAPSFEEARERAYAACELINFEGKFYRSDIGLRALS